MRLTRRAAVVAAGLAATSPLSRTASASMASPFAVRFYAEITRAASCFTFS